jgi:hypothetical protein
LREYREAYELDMKEMAKKRRQQQAFIIDRLLKKWLSLAMEPKEIEGHGYADDQSARAAAIVVKLLERDAKLWNLDLKAAAEEGSVSTATINWYIIQQLSNRSDCQGVEPGSGGQSLQVLELHSGEDDLDS